MDIRSIRKNLDAATAGVWFPFGDDSRVRIAQWHNKEHAAYLREMAKTYGPRLKRGKVNDEEAKLAMARQWQFIITDLEGFTEDGDPVEYSPELIERWAMDDRLVEFFRMVQEIAEDEVNYREENLVEMGKPLQNEQSGISDGENTLEA